MEWLVAVMAILFVLNNLVWLWHFRKSNEQNEAERYTLIQKITHPEYIPLSPGQIRKSEESYGQDEQLELLGEDLEQMNKVGQVMTGENNGTG